MQNSTSRFNLLKQTTFMINSTICLSMFAGRLEKFVRNRKVSRCADGKINAANLKVYTSFNYILMTQIRSLHNSINSSAASLKTFSEIIFYTQNFFGTFFSRLNSVDQSLLCLCWFVVEFCYVTSNLSSCILFAVVYLCRSGWNRYKKWIFSGTNSFFIHERRRSFFILHGTLAVEFYVRMTTNVMKMNHIDNWRSVSNMTQNKLNRKFIKFRTFWIAS